MTNRRWRLAAVTLPVLAAALLFATPASAESCPNQDATGPIARTTYALNEGIEFWGNYTDFADPGTVTITFTRPADGATQTFTAFNLPDGAWLRTVTFTSRQDVGTWDVTLTLAETARTVTCADRVRITGPAAGRTPAPGLTMPPTSTIDAPVTGDTAPAPPAAALATIALAAALAFGTVLVRSVRHAPPGA